MNILKIIICAIILAFVASACNLPATVPSTEPNIEAALTFAIQTITAQAANSPVNPFESVITITPSVTPTPTQTFTPSPTTATVIGDSNCRSGPSKEYEIVSEAKVGQIYPVAGKNTSYNYWIIKLPDGRECWLWGKYAEINGNINELPEYTLSEEPNNSNSPESTQSAGSNDNPSENPPDTPTLFGSIRGVVKAINARSKTITFAGIKVKVDPAGLVTYTDKDGNYFVPNVPIGEVTIKFEYPDYAFRSLANIIVRAGQPSTKAPTLIGQAVTQGPTPPASPTPCSIGHPCIPAPDQPAAP